MNSGNRMNKWAAWVLVVGWALAAQAGYLPELTWLNPKPQGNAIRDIAFPVDTEAIGYAVGDAGTVLRCSPSQQPGGALEWQVVPNYYDTDLHGVSVARYRNSPTAVQDAVFCVGDNGLVLTGTFNKGQPAPVLTRLAIPTTKHLYGVHFIAADEGWVVGQDGEIWHFENTRWTKGRVPGANWLNGVCFPTLRTGYAVGDNGAIWKSTDRGATWTALISGISSRNYYSVYFSLNDDQNGWVVGEGETILRTTDGGSTWTKQNERMDMTIGYYELYLGGRYVRVPKTVTMLSLSDFRKICFNGQYGLAVGGWGAARVATTVNDGQPWSVRTDAGLPELNAVAMPNEKSFAAGEYGALLGHTPVGDDPTRGAWWAPMHQGGLQHITDAHFINDTTAVAVGERGAVYRTTDGLNWTQPPAPCANDLLAVHFVGNQGCAVGGNGQIIRSINAGANWTVIPSPTTRRLRSVHFPTSLIGYAAGDQGAILKSSNGGQTWTVLSPGSSWAAYPFFGAWFVDDKIGVVVGDGGVILRTADGGTTWTRIYSGTANRLLAVQFAGDYGWAVGEKGTILYSTDKGMTWRVQTSGVTEPLNKICMKRIDVKIVIPFLPDETEASYVGMAVGSGGTVLLTQDGGNTWTPEQPRADHPVTTNLKDANFTLKIVYSIDISSCEVTIATRLSTWLFGDGGAILNGSKSKNVKVPCGDLKKIKKIQIPLDFTIAGWITGDPIDASVKLHGIVRLSGDKSREQVLSRDGHYQFKDLPPGNYTVTPAAINDNGISGGSFYPPSYDFAPIASDLRDNNFEFHYQP